MVKSLSTMQETQVHSLGWEDPLEEEMATHSSIAWRIPWTESLVGYSYTILPEHSFPVSEQGNGSVHFDVFTYVVLEQCTVVCSGILYYSLSGFSSFLLLDNAMMNIFTKIRFFFFQLFYYPLEEEMATHSSIAWRIPWTEEPGELQSMGSQRVGHDWATNTFTF